MTVRRIGNATVDFEQLMIEGDAGRFSVEPMVLNVLERLMAHNGNPVERDTLIDEVWGVSFGGDERLSRAISLLRKALGDDARTQSYIQTIPKRGYRLVASFADAQGSPAQTALARVHEPPAHSIAVLPFVKMGANPDNDHIADGMTEELLNALTQVSQLQVTGRTSCFAFKNKNIDIREIGQTLNVAHVVEGSLRCEDGKLRITAQLVDTRDGFHLWSQTYDEVMQDLFALQEKIANAILLALAEILDFEAPQPLTVNLTSSREAYEFFVKGRDLVHRLSGEETLPEAVRLLDRAVAIDPSFSRAWSYLALAHLNLPEYAAIKSDRLHYTAAEIAINRAEEISPDDPVMLRTKALLFCTRHEFLEAIRLYEKAYSLDRSDAVTIIPFGWALGLVGQIDRAIEILHEAERLDPLSPKVCGNLTMCYFNKGEFEKSLYYAEKCSEVGMGQFGAFAAWSLIRLGREREAFPTFHRHINNSGPWMKEQYGSLIAQRLIYGAIIKKQSWAQWLVGRRLLSKIRSGKGPITSFSPNILGLTCSPGVYFDHVRSGSYAWGFQVFAPALGLLPGTEKVRRDEQFPAFAQEIGLVEIWQKYGWPNVVKPIPGTDGSSLQISVD